MQQASGGQQVQGGYWNPAAAPMGNAPVYGQPVNPGQEALPEYSREPSYPPMLLFKRGCYYVPKFYGWRFGGNGSNQGPQTTASIPFTKNTNILFRNVSVFTADNSALPVGRTPSSCAQIKFTRSYTAGSDSIDSMNGNQLPSAECLCGTGQLPGFFLGNGLMLTSGSYLQIECTTLLNNVQVDIILGVLEEWTLGSANF
jgi:hypothetical protein